MIDVRILGPPQIDGTGQPLAEELLAQPKRLAVLVYLATPHPGTVHLRDSLLALFWPEFASNRARAALRKTVYHLRRLLGSSALVTHGDDGLAVNPSHIRVDLADFNQALKRSDYRQALQLYRGDVLTGFYLSGAREFEKWLDDQRLSARSSAITAAWQIAGEEEAGGNAIEAAHWGRRALYLSGTDETALQRMIELLDRLGDRAGAVREYDAFAHQLRTEFNTEPSPETVTLVQRVRDRSEENAFHTTSPADHTAVADTRLAVSTQAPPNVRVRANHSKRVSITTIGFVVSVAVLVGWMGTVAARAARRAFLNADPSFLETPSRRVLVLPFENRTGDSTLNPIGDVAADWISSSLDRHTPLRATSPGARFREPVDLVSTRPGEQVPRDVMDRATLTHADVALWGSLSEVNGRLQLDVYSYDFSSDSQRSLAEPVTTSRADLMIGIQALRVAVGDLLGVQRDPTILTNSSTETPPPYDAYSEYVRGRWEICCGSVRRAESAFRRALEISPAFLSPKLILGEIFALGRRYGDLDSLLRQLPPIGALRGWDYDVYRWLEAANRGDHIRAADALAKLASTYPSYPLFRRQQLRELMRAGQFREVVALVTAAGPRDAGDFSNYLQTALHMLGSYGAELELSDRRESNDAVPDHVPIRGLIGAGRVDDAVERLERLRLSPSGTGGFPNASVLLITMEEFEIHGYADHARVWREHAMQAIREDTRFSDHTRQQLLLAAGGITPRGDEWRDFLRPFTGSQGNLSARIGGIRDVVSYLASHAATAGDIEHAEFLLDTLEAWIPERFDRGVSSLARAQVYAAIGRLGEAAHLVARAVAQGTPAEALHRPWLRDLRGQDDFDTLTRILALDPQIWLP